MAQSQTQSLNIKQISVDGSEILEDFIEATDAFENPKRLQANVGLANLNTTKGSFPLQRGLQSISSAAFYNFRNGQEWNPFSQRLLVNRYDRNRHGNMDAFERLNASAISLVESSHELMHILLLEPYFMGSESIKSFDDFRTISLTIEALAYWMGDIILTRKIEFQYPDQTPIFYKRRAASSEFYHPYKAFVAEGQSDEIEILTTILHAFLGYETPILNFKTPAGEDLRRVLYGFCTDHDEPLEALYTYLKSSKMFSQYFDRFCKPLNQTNVLPTWPLSFSNILEEPESLITSLEGIFNYLNNLTEDQVFHWRLRRKIQLRAYFAFTTLEAIDSQGICSINSKQVTDVTSEDLQSLQSSLTQYIDELAKLIDIFGKDQDKDILNRLNICDAHYENQMVKFENIFILRRKRLYPNYGKGLEFGLLPNDLDLSGTWIAEIHYRINFDYNRLGYNVKLAETEHFTEILTAVRKCAESTSKEDQKILIDLFNQWVLKYPFYHRLVNVVQNPSTEKFHETLFLYS